MNVDDEATDREAADSGHRVTWFAPDRPVEGTTFFLVDDPGEEDGRGLDGD